MKQAISHPYIWVPDADLKTWVIESLDTSMISIESIAKGLAKACRFAGQIDCFYSVAQHSVHLRSLTPLPAHKRIYALLHDAAEAYIGDISKPIKATLPDFNELEYRVQRVIHDKFGLDWPMPEIIKEYDQRILLNEAEQLFDEPPSWVADHRSAGIDPLDLTITPWIWEQAYDHFLSCFRLDIKNYMNSLRHRDAFI